MYQVLNNYFKINIVRNTSMGGDRKIKSEKRETIKFPIYLSCHEAFFMVLHVKASI